MVQNKFSQSKIEIKISYFEHAPAAKLTFIKTWLPSKKKAKGGKLFTATYR